MSKLVKIALVAVMLLALTSFAQSEGIQKKNIVFHTFSIALPMDWGGTWDHGTSIEVDS